MNWLFQMFEWVNDSDSSAAFLKLYVSGMRASMFTGFLTLCGFLLSATTFIVIQMKNEVYGKPFYLEQISQQRKLNPTLSVYGPLRRMARALTIAIVFCFTASMLQFTLGLKETILSTMICLAFGCIALGSVAWVIVLMSINLRAWFEKLEEQANKQMRECQTQSSASS